MALSTNMKQYDFFHEASSLQDPNNPINQLLSRPDDLSAWRFSVNLYYKQYLKLAPNTCENFSRIVNHFTTYIDRKLLAAASNAINSGNSKDWIHLVSVTFNDLRTFFCEPTFETFRTLKLFEDYSDLIRKSHPSRLEDLEFLNRLENNKKIKLLAYKVKTRMETNQKLNRSFSNSTISSTNSTRSRSDISISDGFSQASTTSRPGSVFDDEEETPKPELIEIDRPPTPNAVSTAENNKNDKMETSQEPDPKKPKLIVPKIKPNPTPPPIFIEFEGNSKNLASKIMEISLNLAKIKLFQNNNLKITTRCIDTHNAILNFLNEENLKYSTIDSIFQRPIKVLIRGLPPTTDTIDIKNQLTELGFECLRIAALKNRRTAKLMPLHMVSIKRDNDLSEIYKVKQLNYMAVEIVPFRSPKVRQCYRCQAYNHSSELCKLTPRCIKCAASHLSKDCPHKFMEKPICANCTGSHPANYHLCPANPCVIANSRKQKPKKKRTPKNKNTLVPNVTTVTDSEGPGAAFETANRNSPSDSASTSDLPKPTTDGATPKQPIRTKLTPREKNFDSDLGIKDIISLFKELNQIFNWKQLLAVARNIKQKINGETDPWEKLQIILGELPRIFV